MLSIQAVCGLPRLRAPGIVPCIISLAEASTREPVLVSSVITSTGSLAGITYSAADLLRKCSRSATVQAEIIRYSHQGY